MPLPSSSALALGTILAVATSSGAYSAHARTAPASSKLDQVVGQLGGTGDRYRTARTHALATLSTSPSLQAELNARVKTLELSDETFANDVKFLVLAAHLDTTNVTSAFAPLDGLTASHYLKRRRPRAGAVRELVRREIPAALLYERLTWTLDETMAQVSRPGDFPAKFAKDSASWIAKEKAGHVEALVHALGSSDSALAPFALKAHLRSATGIERATTLLALGKTRAPGLVDIFLREVASVDDDSRQTATVALGTLRSIDATRALANLVANKDTGIRLAAIRALGMAASVRAKDADQPQRLAIAVDALVPLLDRVATKAESDAVIQTLSQLPSETTRARLGASTADAAAVVLTRLDRKARRTRR